MIEINLWAACLAAVASFAFGALWYSPLMFLNSWAQQTGVDPTEPVNHPARVYGLSFVFTLVAALALAYLLGPAPALSSAVATGAGVGLCLVAMSLGINYQFAGHGLTLWSIDSGFHIFRFALMGLILGLWH